MSKYAIKDKAWFVTAERMPWPSGEMEKTNGRPFYLGSEIMKCWSSVY